MGPFLAQNLPPEKLLALPDVESAEAYGALERELLRHVISNGPPPPHRSVFTNRTLRLEKIRYVGFDLDWTLADYVRSTTLALIFDLSRDRMVQDLGYPEALREVRFDSSFARRGLLIDRQAGTVIKMNRHRFVGRAYLGKRRLDDSERKRLYRHDPINPASDRFYHVDSLFELPEVNLYAELIELSQRPENREHFPAPERIFADVRQIVDTVHRDGTLKKLILAEPQRFLERDREVALALQRFALGGRRLMLITNAEWFYTKAICSYLFDGILPGVHSWLDLFDLVVVSARKPSFFRSKVPFQQIDADGKVLGSCTLPSWKGTYTGGCRDGLAGLLGDNGEEVLYVGDHIHSDIVATKIGSTWRTALIVSELEEEILRREELVTQERQLLQLKRELSALGHQMDDARDVLTLEQMLAALSNNGSGNERCAQLEVLLADYERRHRELRSRAAALREYLSSSFNPYWGSVFRQGGNKSRFGNQVSDFACIYSSRVSNFARYGTFHYFRVGHDAMVHEDEPAA
ncbi:MAG: HAD-IG family 5'-nucleotidase [Candidatus Schekmanbacteria bacterium]|nr:HAD-IG family 5'-nucleotidase [Candidatus Schekmanbacteria bacterium]